MTEIAVDCLLGPADPPPYIWHNRSGRTAMLIVCDHAANAVPARLAGLGLDDATRSAHIGWDIGAAAVTRQLAKIFDAPALLAGYSRLVIDCNRDPADPNSIITASDGIDIPGNQQPTQSEIEQRRSAIFDPYHSEIAATLDTFLGAGVVPAVLSIHSFTPTMNGIERPWPVAVCWNRDDRLAAPVLRALLERGIDAGNNEPYGLELDEDYTVIEHALGRGLPHLMVELSQSLIGEDAGAAHWAAILAAAIEPVLGETHRIEPPDLAR
jgi:predicted N-formylglutamate amidohydrolase